MNYSPFYAVGYAHRPKEIRADKVYSPHGDKCRFVGYAIDVNWTNTPQISKANESNFVHYKDSYIIIIDGKRSIRRDVIFELYQNQPTILKVEPSDRDPSDLKQYSNYTNEEYLEEFDHQLSQPMRDPNSIFSKSLLHRKRSEPDRSKVTNPRSTSTLSHVENPTIPLRSKRNLRSTEKYVVYRSNLTERSHPSFNQLNARITNLVSDPELQIHIDKTDNTPQCPLVPQTLEEALSGLDARHWYEAWQKEKTKIEDRKNWVLITQEEIDTMVVNALKSKYTFRTWKYKVMGR
jgi:hypothetical protein